MTGKLGQSAEPQNNVGTLFFDAEMEANIVGEIKITLRKTALLTYIVLHVI